MLILTTSNISEAIDLAFVDRADIKQFIGLPSINARYTIIASCFKELVRAGIIRTAGTSFTELPPLEVAQFICGKTQRNMQPELAGSECIADTEVLVHLLNAASNADGLSGRALRKVPLQAHAF